MSEFNLSDKIEDLTGGDYQEIENWDSAIHTEDVKEFIRRLKEDLFSDPEACCHGVREKQAFEKIDKFAGNKLI